MRPLGEHGLDILSPAVAASLLRVEGEQTPSQQLGRHLVKVMSRCCIGDKMSYMDAQNLGVVPLESYSRTVLNLAVLKVCIHL